MMVEPSGLYPTASHFPRVVCPLSPMAEAGDLKSPKYRFEPDRGYKVRLGYLPAVPEGCIPLGTEVLVRVCLPRHPPPWGNR